MNSEFFFLLGRLLCKKNKKKTDSFTIFIAGERTDRFLMTLVPRVKQAAESIIWTRLVGSITNDDYDYATSAFK